MRSVVLSGFMGTGKSTIGPALAGALGVPFVDTDSEIEAASGCKIPDLWQKEGEAAFRLREAELAQQLLSERTERVIALGGGAVLDARTRRLALDRSLLVTLTASPQAILERIPDFAARPHLAVSNPAARVTELLAQRAEVYAECHLSLATDGMDIHDSIREIIRARERDALVVPLGARSYTVDVCLNDPGRLSEAILRSRPSLVLWVTDANVAAARDSAFGAATRAFEVPLHRVVLAPGERHKTIDAVRAIWDAGLNAGVDRDAVVVAAGGGVVGDLAGFAAATLLRGVRYVQAPTTVLSMVDSSVGGKTGFDHAAGKNLIGAFHQPSGVVADLEHLTTLSARERVAGLAEVAKIALVSDAPLLARVEQDAIRLARGDVDALLPAVRAAVEAKIRIVRDDEREAGPRALLNLGHTVGHALEARGGFSRFLHGEAVAMGTMAELRATANLGWTPAAIVERAGAVFAALGLPSASAIDRHELEAAWAFVASDKKRGGNAIRLPVVTGAGRAEVRRVSLLDLRRAVLAS
jgi:3-dehydroquinate synthase